MSYYVKLDNNLTLEIISETPKGNDNMYLIFQCEVDGICYKEKSNLKQFSKDINDKDFLKNKDNYKYEIKKKENNECLLTIYNNEKNKSLILKYNTNEGNTEDAPPSSNQINEVETKGKTDIIEEFLNKYDEEIKQIIKENEELVNENKKLKKEIDEEKRKSDEIVRIFLENREKYEKAVMNNSDIAQIQNTLK